MIKKFILITLSLVVLISGAVAGVYLVQKRQNTEPEAAVVGDTGLASISLTPPDSNSLQVGSTFPIAVTFNTKGQSITGVSVKIDYDYTGTIAPFEPISVTENSALVQTYRWRYTAKNGSCANLKCTIEIAAVQSGSGSYSSPTETQLATINFKVNGPGSTDLRFNLTDTQIISTTGQDILDISSINKSWVYSTGTAPVNTIAPTTPPNTQPPNSPTPGNNNSEPSPTTVPLPTQPQALPEAGNATNTLMLLLMGVMIMLGGAGVALITRKS